MVISSSCGSYQGSILEAPFTRPNPAKGTKASVRPVFEAFAIRAVTAVSKSPGKPLLVKRRLN
jgi:hypothetical protein